MPRKNKNENVVEEKVETKAVEETSKPADAVATQPPAARASYDPKTAILSKADQMKEHLESQQKVLVFIPLEKGEKVGKARKTFCINHYQVSYPKGVQVAVPEQIAGMIQERYYAESLLQSKSLEQQDKDRKDALNY